MHALKYAVSLVFPKQSDRMATVMSETETLTPDDLIRVDSKYPNANIFKTLVLLALDPKKGAPIYFVVEGCAKWAPMEEVRGHDRYFYEEHTCPTNFIQIPMISQNGDTDPHGLFRYVDTVWMTTEYDEDDDETFLRFFPVLREVTNIVTT